MLGKRIGHGGMGKVFRARHRHLDRILAIKFVAANHSRLSEALQRFEHETRALGQLQHPQIVNAVDAGNCNGLMYLVTEYIDGEDLSQLVQRRGPLPPVEACALVQQAAEGLAYLHSRGFVHRDIKPSNLIVDRAGCVKLLDFGLVRSIHTDHQLTDDGQTLGTWDFLSPEQAHDSSDVDCRSDLYSLGCTLLYLLTGDVPFGGARFATPAAKLKGHLFDRPAALEQPGIPPELAAVLSRMLAKLPSDRIGSADEVHAALAPFAGPVRETGKDRSSAAAGGILALTSWTRMCAVLVVIVLTAVFGATHSLREDRHTVAPSASGAPAQAPAASGAPVDPDGNGAPEPAPGSSAARDFAPRPLDRTTITPHRTNDASPVRLQLPNALSQQESTVVTPR